MTQTEQLSERFREVMLSGKWVADMNYKKGLSDLNREQATTKVASFNTLAALAFHINYYVAGVLNVFEGGKLEIRDKYSYDMPEITSEAQWQQLLNTLLDNSEKFANHLAKLPDSKLDEHFVDEKYGTYRRNMNGMIEHCYYHLGQLALIRKEILAA